MAEPVQDRHIVLIHGAWQGSWSFDAWRPMLQARGWHVHAVDLPGNGWPPLGDAPASLDSYTDHVVGLLARIGEPAVVLGHSGGGITASQVAQAAPARVAALVYLAGMMLPSGLGYADLVRQAGADGIVVEPAGIAPWLDWNADRTATTVRPEGAWQIFLHDCAPDAARRALSLLRPQPESGRAICNRLSADGWGRVPRIYVECRDDRSVLPALQRRMLQLSPGARRLSLNCGHLPQLAQPQRLTRLLLPELEALLHRA